ncbi:phosphate acetyltransferase [Candidatus Sumerlaeota bacterium]|nr:phosphate acetyltransferase [Candidatus Sumerlaeota bacterium]
MGVRDNEILQSVVRRVKLGTKPRVLFPESDDERVLRAAARLNADGLVDVILLGDEIEIKKRAQMWQIDLTGVQIFNNTDGQIINELRDEFIRIRTEQGKRVNPSVAQKMVSNPLFTASLLVRRGDADTMVAGAVNTTANVVRAALYVLGLAPGTRTLNSSFLMVTNQGKIGEKGVLLFADCAVVPDPTPEQLAEIAESTAQTASILFETEPKVAFLSFSTYGSASHPLIEKVRRAVELCRAKNPGLTCDGELQADAALIPEIARRKCPQSVLEGRANVLIFPDLNAGNLCYKLVERLCGAMALGPLLQNVSIPVSDLSRGCDEESIYYVALLTALRVQLHKKD